MILPAIDVVETVADRQHKLSMEYIEIKNLRQKKIKNDLFMQMKNRSKMRKNTGKNTGNCS